LQREPSDTLEDFFVLGLAEFQGIHVGEP